MPYPAKVDAEKILQSALEMIEANGIEALSMRSLAESLSLTVSSLYRYYPGRAALETAIAGYAAGLLQAEFERARRRSGDAVLETALHGYLRFARKRPVLYALLLAHPTPKRTAEQPLKALWNAFLSIVSTVTGNPDDTGAAVAIWSFIHGYIALEQSGQFGKSGPKNGFDRGLRALSAGLQEEGRSEPSRARMAPCG